MQYVQCISELCFKFQVPASNTLGGIAATKIVLQCGMVQNMCFIQGDVILQNVLNQNSRSFIHMSNAYLNCVSSFKTLHQILWEKLRRQEQYYSVRDVILQ